VYGLFEKLELMPIYFNIKRFVMDNVLKSIKLMSWWWPKKISKNLRLSYIICGHIPKCA